MLRNTRINVFGNRDPGRKNRQPRQRVHPRISIDKNRRFELFERRL
jgi:hypothetical protein